MVLAIFWSVSGLAPQGRLDGSLAAPEFRTRGGIGDFSATASRGKNVRKTVMSGRYGGSEQEMGVFSAGKRDVV